MKTGTACKSCKGPKCKSSPKIVSAPNSLWKLFLKRVLEPNNYDVHDKICCKHGIYQFEGFEKAHHALKLGMEIALKAQSCGYNVFISCNKDGGSIVILSSSETGARAQILALAIEILKS